MKSLTTLCVLGCIALLIQVAAADTAIVYARDFYKADSPTLGIQDAINSLPPEGGQVILEARTYVLRAPLVLRENLRITGQGAQTILTRGKEIIHSLTADAPTGANSVTVDSTEGLRVGDMIGLRDDDRYGWYMSHGIITKIEGNTITFDDVVTRDLSVERHAKVLNYFPIVEAYRIWDYRYHLGPFVIEDFVIDGNLAENPNMPSDWSCAAIHLASTGNGLVQRIWIRSWITDGFSDQYGLNNTFRDCVVENCRGNGFHPGTGVRGSRFFNNLAQNNEGDGLFFCAEVTACQVIGNEFFRNKNNGIGGLGGGGDSFNLVSGNTCRENGLHGILADGGGRNVITSNICLNNSVSKPGECAGIALENATDCLVTGNLCGTKVSNRDQPTQGYGVLERGKSDRNIIQGNIAAGNTQAGVQTVGAATVAADNLSSPPEPAKAP